MSIAQDLVDAALRKLGNHAPQTVDRNNAFLALNTMLSSWSARKLMIYAVTRENFTLTIGVGNYTIGAGGAFNTVRPNKIEYAFLREGDNDYELDVSTSLSDYEELRQKDVTDIPENLYYLQEYPLGRILFDYLPDKAYGFYMDSTKALTSFAKLSTSVVLPPEYERALIFNLAVEVAPEYDQEVAPEIAVIAAESMAIVEAINHQPIPEVEFDPMIRRGRKSNILSGDIIR